MAAKDELGRAGEEQAALYLTNLGYRILDRNWRCVQGEIDLVAAHGRDLVVVEVKTRSALSHGHPLEAVDARKLRRLWQLGHAWATAHPEQSTRMSIRIDAIGIIGADPTRGTLEHLVGLS